MSDDVRTCRRCAEPFPASDRFCPACGHDHEINPSTVRGYQPVITPGSSVGMGPFGKSAVVAVGLWFVLAIAIWILSYTADPSSSYGPDFGQAIGIALLSFAYPFFGLIVGLVALIFSRPVGAGLLAGTGIATLIGALACFALIGDSL